METSIETENWARSGTHCKAGNTICQFELMVPRRLYREYSLYCMTNITIYDFADVLVVSISSKREFTLVFELSSFFRTFEGSILVFVVVTFPVILMPWLMESFCRALKATSALSTAFRVSLDICKLKLLSIDAKKRKKLKVK